uniref:Uncharacterized protein n=1 Tax=Caenorhabditis japonica TaxID=281687 RepID=A0A8R1INK4_CAEJA
MVQTLFTSSACLNDAQVDPRCIFPAGEETTRENLQVENYVLVDRIEQFMTRAMELGNVNLEVDPEQTGEFFQNEWPVYLERMDRLYDHIIAMRGEAGEGQVEGDVEVDVDVDVEIEVDVDVEVEVEIEVEVDVEFEVEGEVVMENGNNDN